MEALAEMGSVIKRRFVNAIIIYAQRVARCNVFKQISLMLYK